MTNLLDSINTMIDALNEAVYLKDHPSDDAVNELNALVYAKYVIYSDNVDFNAKMFFKYYDLLEWKSNLIKAVSKKVDYLISSPESV